MCTEQSKCNSTSCTTHCIPSSGYVTFGTNAYNTFGLQQQQFINYVPVDNRCFVTPLVQSTQFITAQPTLVTAQVPILNMNARFVQSKVDCLCCSNQCHCDEKKEIKSEATIKKEEKVVEETTTTTTKPEQTSTSAKYLIEIGGKHDCCRNFENDLEEKIRKIREELNETRIVNADKSEGNKI
jgi:hypothetical protein